MSLTLLLPLLLAGEPAPSAAVSAADPPIRIWINNDGRFLRGDRARVHVRAEDDGYLLVLQADAEGHLRVLFPLDPTDDSFVRGGKKYEVEGRGGRDAFDVGDRAGRGTVYAAVSRAPFRFDEFVLSDHWDYRALEPQRLPEDPESELTELVRRMAQGSFDYDVMSYYVVESVVYANDYYRPSSSFYYDDFGCGYYSSCGSSLSVGLFFRRPFYRRHYYGPYHYAYDPFYDPFFYDPYYYRPYYYSPVYYSPRQYWGYPYHYRNAGYYNYWNRPYTPYRFRDRTLVNTDYRDRRYTFGRAVNTVYTPPRTRFTEPETSSPLRRRSFERDDRAGSEPTLSRRVSGTIVTDRAEPTRPAERRGDVGAIEARRARPSETPRASEDRRRGEPMPVDVTPRRRTSDGSDSRTAQRSRDDSPPRATRAEPRSERRSEPHAEPRSAPRSEPRAEPRSNGGGDRGGWSGGDGGRRGGGGDGGGGMSSSGGGRRR
jgi:uncharacterized membrane protein YgcG